MYRLNLKPPESEWRGECLGRTQELCDLTSTGSALFPSQTCLLFSVLTFGKLLSKSSLLSEAVSKSSPFPTCLSPSLVNPTHPKSGTVQG